MPNSAGLPLNSVTKRPVFHPNLGAFFSALRVQRRLGFRQAVTIAQAKGLTALTKQALFGLEHGLTKNPDPDVLRAVAELYDVDYPWVVANFVGHRYGLSSTTSLDLMKLAEDAEHRGRRTGAGTGGLLTAKDQKLLDRIRALDDDDAHLVLTMLRQLEQKKRKTTGRKTSKRPRVA